MKKLIRASSEPKGLKDTVKDYLNHHLYGAERYCFVDSAEIVSEPDERGYTDVMVEYHVRVHIPVGIDRETGRTEYEDDTEYRRNVIKLKLD